MALRKSSRTGQVIFGSRRLRKVSPRYSTQVIHYLAIAAVGGAGIGIGSVALTPDGRSQISSTIKPLAIAWGMVRAREPQIGDHWRGCNDARAAGTAPIYAGEPGYREGLDGDFDGIACEPHRGR
jgi:hypothetical protein